MSAGFEVMWVRPIGPGEAGRSRRFEDTWMEDVYAAAGVGHHDERGNGVMCTIEFGLMLVRRSCPEEEMHAHEMVNGHAAANGHEVNGHAHAPKLNGHAKANGVANGASIGVNGMNGHGHHHDPPPASLTRTVLVKPRVLLDSIAQLV